LTPSTSDVWVLRDSTSPTPEVIARLTSAGTLYLKGAWYEKETSLSPPSGENAMESTVKPGPGIGRKAALVTVSQRTISPFPAVARRRPSGESAAALSEPNP
jgi:hypothetical protein